jgi:hypothetical protein
MVNVRNLFEPAGNGELNQVILEGIVYMRWEYSTDAFAGLAIYDRYAPIPNGQERKRGRHQSLLETGDEKVIALLGRLPNADKTHEVQIQQENLHVDARALITFSGRHAVSGVAA